MTFSQNTSKINTTRHINNNIPLKSNLFLVDFENDSLVAHNWDLVSQNNQFTWKLDSFDPHGGSNYANCRYDSTLTEEQNEKLISPLVNLSGFSSVSLNFWFQFSKYWGITPKNNYDLLVLASTDGTTFSDTLWRETDTDTNSWNSFEWVNANVNLNAYIGSSIRLAFVYSGFDGAEAAIDDILLTTLGGLSNQQMIKLELSPNPTSDFIRFQTLPGSDISVFSADGRLMMNTISSEQISTYDVSSLQPGIYFVRLSHQGEIAISKFVKK